MIFYSIIHICGGGYGLAQWDTKDGIGRLIGEYSSESVALESATNLARIDAINVASMEAPQNKDIANVNA